MEVRLTDHVWNFAEPLGAGVGIAASVPSTAMQPPDPLIRCAICGKPISLEQSKVTEDGRAVHEECYVAKLKGQKPKPQ
jgi:hypothetical protein